MQGFPLENLGDPNKGRSTTGFSLGVTSEFSPVCKSSKVRASNEEVTMLPQTKYREIPAFQASVAASSLGRVSPAHLNRQMLFGCVELSGPTMAFDRNAEIYGDGEPADYIYMVVSGAARTYKVLSDGRRQISAFHMPGDVFGLESGEEHASSAEAITESTILMVRRSLVFKAAERNSDIAKQLWSLTAKELRRSQNHALLLVKSAQERLAAFLLAMAERLPQKASVELPMSRQDIADHLGLTIETVSRTLTQLVDSSIIRLLASRRIVLSNRAVLSELNG
jgi:CRP/FNR family transcriptional regulator, nitrogen fixation regulation protein